MSNVLVLMYIHLYLYKHHKQLIRDEKSIQWYFSSFNPHTRPANHPSQPRQLASNSNMHTVNLIASTPPANPNSAYPTNFPSPRDRIIRRWRYRHRLFLWLARRWDSFIYLDFGIVCWVITYHSRPLWCDLESVTEMGFVTNPKRYCCYRVMYLPTPPYNQFHHMIYTRINRNCIIRIQMIRTHNHV